MPRPTSFGKDTGLQIRMTVTMFLLGLIYVVLIVALLAANVNGITVAIIAGGLAAVNLFASDKLALAAMGARVVTPQEAPQLHAMIERLCVQADVARPGVAVANTSMPNAFALGRSPKSATVCATTGIMELLSPSELEGVMAHELTHVANRDVLVMTLASFFATIAAYIVQFGFFFGGSSDDDDNPSFMVLLLVSLGVYVISFFLMQALSRYREFAADRGSALIPGPPSAPASRGQGGDRLPAARHRGLRGHRARHGGGRARHRRGRRHAHRRHRRRVRLPLDGALGPRLRGHRGRRQRRLHGARGRRVRRAH